MSPQAHFKFRLYVAGAAGNSAAAVANLNSLCRAYLSGRYEIELIDVFREPARALADIVVMTPTLIKYAPNPTCRIVGSLADMPTVLLALGLSAKQA